MEGWREDGGKKDDWDMSRKGRINEMETGKGNKGRKHR